MTKRRRRAGLIARERLKEGDTSGQTVGDDDLLEVAGLVEHLHAAIVAVGDVDTFPLCHRAIPLGNWKTPGALDGSVTMPALPTDFLNCAVRIEYEQPVAVEDLGDIHGTVGSERERNRLPLDAAAS